MFNAFPRFLPFLVRYAFYLVESCNGVANVSRIVQRLSTLLGKRELATADLVPFFFVYLAHLILTFQTFKEY